MFKGRRNGQSNSMKFLLRTSKLASPPSVGYNPMPTTTCKLLGLQKGKNHLAKWLIGNSPILVFQFITA
ncbi:MAG: hypothetical protein WBK94_08985 [Tenuifilaceae bacterium]|jgi:hypothetical protein|nr:hypothetical protein [Bacteroidales bacterium]